MGGPEIERLIGLLAKLPGMGPRSARRAALRMLQQPEARMLPLAAALAEAARAVKPCRIVRQSGQPRSRARSAPTPTAIRALICVVEGVGDLWALERAHGASAACITCSAARCRRWPASGRRI